MTHLFSDVTCSGVYRTRSSNIAKKSGGGGSYQQGMEQQQHQQQQQQKTRREEEDRRKRRENLKSSYRTAHSADSRSFGPRPHPQHCCNSALTAKAAAVNTAAVVAVHLLRCRKYSCNSNCSSIGGWSDSEHHRYTRTTSATGCWVACNAISVTSNQLLRFALKT